MQGDFEKTQTKLLGDLFCSADAIDKAAVSGTVTNWLNPHLFVDKQLDTFGQMLARELQGRSVEDCPHLKVLNPGTVQLISSATAQTAPDDPRPDTTTPPP